MRFPAFITSVDGATDEQGLQQQGIAGGNRAARMAPRGGARRRRLRHRLPGEGHLFRRTRRDQGIFPELDQRTRCEDTVVPIDSEAEEVHALGLKKFVEEAKLLWNLSTPTRHPNIVSVRSLFEIHGTAYMVMDFEDGLSLSKMLQAGPDASTSAACGTFSADRRGARARPPGRRAPPRHQAAQHPGQRGRPAGADRLRLGALRHRRSDQHQGHLPHPALRRDRAICENLSAGPVDRHLRARRGHVRMRHGREAARGAGAASRRARQAARRQATGPDTASASCRRSMRR